MLTTPTMPTMQTVQPNDGRWPSWGLFDSVQSDVCRLLQGAVPKEWAIDDNYSLEIVRSSFASPHRLDIVITGSTIFGIGHGLKTLASMVEVERGRHGVHGDRLFVPGAVKGLRFADGPRFPMRGLMLDTAHVHMPLAELKPVLFAAAVLC